MKVSFIKPFIVGVTPENRQPGRAVVLARRRQQWFAIATLVPALSASRPTLQ